MTAMGNMKPVVGKGENRHRPSPAPKGTQEQSGRLFILLKQDFSSVKSGPIASHRPILLFEKDLSEKIERAGFRSPLAAAQSCLPNE